MPISFNQIPIDIRTPGQFIEFDNTRAVQGLPAIRHKILVIGQRLTTGTVAANLATQINSKAQAEESFGRGSMLSAMFNALKDANGYTESYGIALDDLVAGALASGTITFTGPATAAGTVNFYIAGKAVKVGVAAADTATAIATAVKDAINADTSLPVVATSLVGAVTITARHKGICGNYIDLRLNYYAGERLPTGVGATIVAMASGTGNPDIATAIAAIGDNQFHTIIMPYTDTANLAALETELVRRFGPLVMKEGHGFAAVSGTLADGTTLGNARNCPHMTIMGCQKSPTAPWIVAAITGAIDAYEPDPARPRQTLVLTGMLPPKDADQYKLSERNTHLYDGISTFTVDAGGNCLIERLITTYQTNAFGVADVSYLDIETMRTIAYLRFSARAHIALKFPRHKLANDGTNFSPGQAIVTPKIIRAELIVLFQDWELAGLAENRDQYKTDLLVERDADKNRVNAIIPPDCVNQFRIFAAQVQFRL
jgi:phage tail sheath gpL-like